MALRTPLELDEWYHCYNRGVDKRVVFESQSDYERLALLLYVGNGSIPIHISNLKEKSIRAVVADTDLDRGEQIVEIGAYTLMPNHFHLVLKEVREGGIVEFMQRMCTGYTMYFNKKNERSGALFAGPFKSLHVADDRYLKRLVAYVHLNPAKIFDPQWKEGAANIEKIKSRLLAYPYSSLPDFLNYERPERKILGDSIFDLFDSLPTLSEIVEDANSYYSSKASP